MNAWQPMDTAPQDGRYILLWWPYWNRLRPVIARWFCNSWDTVDALEGDDAEPPLAWMSLALPPSE